MENQVNWQDLIGVARPLVFAPQEGAQVIKEYWKWAGSSGGAGSSTEPVAKTPKFQKAVEAMTTLKGDDLPDLFNKTKKKLANTTKQQPAQLGYLAVLGAMSDHLAALNRRHMLDDGDKKLFTDVQSELKLHQIW